jgi:hypothetical protein
MNSAMKSAPLTLLLSGAASQAGIALKAFFASNGEIVLAHKATDNASAIEIVYQGVSLRVATTADKPQMSGLKPIFCNLDPASIGCGIELGLGEHVAGGERIPAIVQALLGAAQKLGASLGAVGVIWHPAQVMSGFSYFAEAVMEYNMGGVFPVLALVNFKAESDGSINSTGLAFLSGQELQVAAKGMDQSETMRRVVRVVHDIATNGPIQTAIDLPGIELDEIVELRPLPETGLLKMNAYPARPPDLSR